MKTLKLTLAMILAAVAATGCMSSYYSARSNSGYTDDLYATHDRAQIARRQKEEADIRKAQAEARRAEWEAKIAEAQAAAAQESYYSQNNKMSFSNVLADSYESAYARRLNAFKSPTYNMPSSYWELRYSPAYNYVSAYDPAYYNIIVMGDNVWVEPKYITSMFGRWGLPTVATAGYAAGLYSKWYFDWGYSPWYSWTWGYPRYSWGWYDSWFGTGYMWSFGWGASFGWGWPGRPWPNYPGWVYPGHGPSHPAGRPVPDRPGLRPGHLAGSSQAPGSRVTRPGGYNIGGNRAQQPAAGSQNNRRDTQTAPSRGTGNNRQSYDSGRSSRSDSGSSSYNGNSNRSSYSGSSSRSGGGSYSGGGGYSSGGTSRSSGGGGGNSRGR